MLKLLLKNPLYLFILLCVATGFAYWLGYKTASSRGLRPAVLVKEMPPKKRRAKPILQTSEAKPESISSDEQTLDRLETKLSDPAAKAPEDPSKLGVGALTDELLLGLQELKTGTKENIRRNIAVASALIEKEPDLYFAYKSKLINLLMLEVRFGETIEIEEYENLYDEMLSFEGVNAMDETLEDLRLDQKNGDALSSAELVDIDQDLIHIPFLRLSALNDLENLADIAEEYVDSFPDSYIGYLYLAEAFWRNGDEVGALNTLQDGLNQESKNEMILRLFSFFQQSPLERLNRTTRLPESL